MGKPLLTLVEVCKSPSPGREEVFRHLLGDHCQLQSSGALDHLSDQALLSQKPLNKADVLYANLPSDGRSVRVSKTFVIQALRKYIGELTPDDTAIRLLCCTGEFPEFSSSPILMPSTIIRKVLPQQLEKGATLGVFVPCEGQEEEAIEQWGGEGYRVITMVLPEDAPPDWVTASAMSMCRESPDKLFFDSMSYTTQFQANVANICPIPSILATTAVAEHIKALLVDAAV